MFTLITPAMRGRYKDLLCRIFATREGYYDSGLSTSMEEFDTPSTLYIAYEGPVCGWVSDRPNPFLSQALLRTVRASFPAYGSSLLKAFNHPAFGRGT